MQSALALTHNFLWAPWRIRNYVLMDWHSQFENFKTVAAGVNSGRWSMVEAAGQFPSIQVSRHPSIQSRSSVLRVLKTFASSRSLPCSSAVACHQSRFKQEIVTARWKMDGIGGWWALGVGWWVVF